MDVTASTPQMPEAVAVKLTEVVGVLKLIDQKVEGLAKSVEAGATDQNRILSDHEGRLRILEEIRDSVKMVKALSESIVDHEKRIRGVEGRLYLMFGGLAVLNFIVIIVAPAIRVSIVGH